VLSLLRLATGQGRIAALAAPMFLGWHVTTSVNPVDPMVSVVTGCLAPGCVSVPPLMDHGVEDTVKGAPQDIGAQAVKGYVQVLRLRSAQGTVHVSMG